MSTPAASTHSWTFFRTGGLDQVALTTGADLLALDQLDQKLWVALSCPVKGLELDDKTLALVDTDGDGRIRVPEVIGAIKWAAPYLNDAGVLLAGTDGLPLSVLNSSSPEGQSALTCARQILANLGRKDASVITVADVADTAKIFAASPLNGDGVIPPEASTDATVQQLIKDIVACTGGKADRTGSVGVTAEQITAFFADLAAFSAWAAKASDGATSPLGAGTATALAAVNAVRAKVDDYFARCRLAAFDTRALAALNRSETEYLAIAAKDMKITSEEVAGFPLSRIEAGRALPLLDGANPAWAGALAKLHADAVVPVFGAAKAALTEADWASLKAKLAAYEAWLGAKAGASVEKLGAARAAEILAGNGRAAVEALVTQDLALAPGFAAIAAVEKLARFHRDLRALLHNFVNFADFYSRDKWAVFQSGTLYLDSRSTELCIRVDGPNPLAAMSKTYIAYCTCTRPGQAPMTIAACFTQGDSDFLFVGRHGVFYDRKGRDWEAVITSIVDNPISVRQAFWAPYKKFVRLIEEQIAKRAAAAEAESSGKLAAAAEKTAHADKAKPAEPPKKFDLAVVTGIGVALGSIGGFLAAIFSNFVNLGMWMPLGVVGILLVISGPSMIIAWLKLRQRTLGPLLEGNGWAVNGRVKINIPFGTALTDVAVLPTGSKRSLEDPYEDKESARRQRRLTFLVVIVLLAAAAIFIRWKRVQTGHYFWQPAPAPAAAAPAEAKK
ncbi:MAG: hypothetical protein HZC55_22685 [Verrucomicrobia bacterium]|nr:hypothetical protein [Verrucomicrobiota bacterium]